MLKFLRDLRMINFVATISRLSITKVEKSYSTIDSSSFSLEKFSKQIQSFGVLNWISKILNFYNTISWL